jgi:hypothetical protein
MLISSVLQILDRTQLKEQSLPKAGIKKQSEVFSSEMAQASVRVPVPEHKGTNPPPHLVRPLLPDISTLLPGAGSHGVEGYLRAIKKEEQSGAPSKVVDLFE